MAEYSSWEAVKAQMRAVDPRSEVALTATLGDKTWKVA